MKVLCKDNLKGRATLATVDVMRCERWRGPSKDGGPPHRIEPQVL
jgi:hypothetical protein